MIGNSNSALQIENLKSENIKKHVTILGVTGTYSSLPDAVDSGVFWTNPDDDGYYQDCEYVNYIGDNIPLSQSNLSGTNLRKKVKKIVIKGNGITNIQSAFAYNNIFLKEVDMSESNAITTINARAFQSSTIKKVKLPASLEQISSEYAFGYISNYFVIDCTELTFTGTSPNTLLNGINAFSSSASFSLIFSNQETMEVYSQATNWSAYASKMTYMEAE